MTISTRAVSGCDRISDEIDVSVLNRKCGIDLIGERLDARGHQQLLLLGEPMLDPRAVPDLDRDRDAEHRRQRDQEAQPEIGRREQEDGVGELAADRLPEQLEQDWRGDEDDLPVERQLADERATPSGGAW